MSMTSPADECLVWLGHVDGAPAHVADGDPDERVVAAAAREFIHTALLPAPGEVSSFPAPVARAQALVVAISAEIDALHTNAAAARRDVADARDKLVADSSRVSYDTDTWGSKVAVAHDALVSQIDAAEAVKVVALETELVAADAALEAALADCARVQAASALPDAVLAPLLGALQTRLAELKRRCAAIALGPLAEATLVFVPDPAGPDSNEPVLGSLLTTAIRAADLVVSPQWLRPSSSGAVHADGTSDTLTDATPVLHIDVSPKAPMSALGPAGTTEALETLLARGLLKAEAFMGSSTDPASRVPITLVLSGPSRITVLAMLPRQLECRTAILFRRLELRGETLPGATLPLRVGSSAPLSHALHVDDAGRSHFQQPCVTPGGWCYIPKCDYLLIIAEDGVTSERITPPVPSIRACAFDDATDTLLLGTYASEPSQSTVVALVRRVRDLTNLPLLYTAHPSAGRNDPKSPLGPAWRLHGRHLRNRRAARARRRRRCMLRKQDRCAAAF